MHAPPLILSTSVNFSVCATGLDEDRFEYDPSLLLGQHSESRHWISVGELELLQCEQFLQPGAWTVLMKGMCLTVAGQPIA